MLIMDQLKSGVDKEQLQGSFEDSFIEKQDEFKDVPKKWFDLRVIERDVEGTILFQNALVLVEEGEYHLAENLFRTLIEKNSHIPQVIYWLMQCALKRNQLSLARKLSQVLVKEKRDFYSHFFLGNIYYQEKNDILALESYHKALDEQENDSLSLFEIYKNMGNISIKLKELDAAESFFHKARVIDGRNDTLIVNMGTLALQKNEIEKAKKYFREALLLNNDNDRAWAGLALINKFLSDVELSKANAEYALDINPTNRVAIQILIDGATTADQWSAVVDRLKSCLAEDGMDSEISFALAKIFMQQKKWAEASLEISRCQVLNPDLPQLEDLCQIVKKEIENLRSKKSVMDTERV